VNLIGGVSCVGVMFLIAPLPALIALTAELILWLLLSRREHAAGWGDARRGLYESLIRWALVRLTERPVSPRSWRPHTLVFVDGLQRELDLVRYADWFSQGRSVVTVCELVVGDLGTDEIDTTERLRAMREVLAEEDVVAFPEVDIVPDIVEGIVSVAQANGMAGIASNTILLGWPSSPELQIQFLEVERSLSRLGKSLIVGRFKPNSLFRRKSRQRFIDVWWGGLQHNGDLMLLLAYLLSRNSDWRDARVRILSVATTETAKAQTELFLGRMLGVIRIDADYEIHLKDKDRSVREMIQAESAEADVVFLGLAPTPPGKEAEAAARMEQLAGDLPSVFFVHNASLFTGALLDSSETTDVDEAVRKRLPGGSEE
jgi:hypothetical protein